jgi:hypothetical protein
MVVIWLVVAFARAIAFVLVPDGLLSGVEPPQSDEGTRLAIGVVDLIGGVGWILLFVFYFVLLSRRRAPAWWSLGAFCVGPNLLLYIALLLVSKRRSAVAAAASSGLSTFGGEKLPRSSAFLLKGSFVCASCDSLLNYGVSECRECGARFEYSDGAP